MNLSISISIIAVLISAGTAWFTIFHRGTVGLTKPHFFAIVHEDLPFGGWLKIFMRGLLFSTGRRGRVIENMYLALKHDGQEFPFHYWMYGTSNPLNIGSGLFVGHEGVSTNHHFVPTGGLSANSITPGHYQIEVHASLVGVTRPILLQRIKFELGTEEASVVRSGKDKTLMFIWDQEKKRYRSRIDSRPPTFES